MPTISHSLASEQSIKLVTECCSLVPYIPFKSLIFNAFGNLRCPSVSQMKNVINGWSVACYRRCVHQNAYIIHNAGLFIMCVLTLSITCMMSKYHIIRHAIRIAFLPVSRRTHVTPPHSLTVCRCN